MTLPIDAATARKFVENVFCAGYHHDPDKMIQESEWLPFVDELLRLAVPSVPDAVREAAENIFSFYEMAGVPDATTFDCIVARFILSGRGAGDDRGEPVTAEWWKCLPRHRKGKLCVIRLDNGDICVDDGHFTVTVLTDNPTRGQLRQLLSALGIAAEPAKEV